MRQIIHTIRCFFAQPLSPADECAREGHLMWPRITSAREVRRYVELCAGDMFPHLTGEWNNRPRFHAKACVHCDWDSVIDPMLEEMGAR